MGLGVTLRRVTRRRICVLGVFLWITYNMQTYTNRKLLRKKKKIKTSRNKSLHHQIHIINQINPIERNLEENKKSKQQN